MSEGYTVYVGRPIDRTSYVFHGTCRDWCADGRMTRLLMQEIYTNGPARVQGIRHKVVAPTPDKLYYKLFGALNPLPPNFYVRNHDMKTCYVSESPNNVDLPSALVSLASNREGFDHWFNCKVSIVKPKGKWAHTGSFEWEKTAWSYLRAYYLDFVEHGTGGW